MTNSRNPIEGIIFDKDGTLLDFEATWGLWAQGFLTQIAEDDNALAIKLGQAIGFDHPSARFLPASLAIAGSQGEVAAALAAHLPGVSKDAMIERMNTSSEDIPLAEVVPLRPLIKGLSDRGLRLGVATNDAEAPARAHLQAAGVLEYFPFVAGFDTGFGYKPDPGQLLGFIAKFDLDPARVLMVGDSTHDLHAGRAAGMIAVAVLSGPSGAEELAPHADVVIGDISELPQWLNRREAAE